MQSRLPPPDITVIVAYLGQSRRSMHRPIHMANPLAAASDRT